MSFDRGHLRTMRLLPFYAAVADPPVVSIRSVGSIQGRGNPCPPCCRTPTSGSFLAGLTDYDS
jgi:hypothetical protein